MLDAIPIVSLLQDVMTYQTLWTKTAFKIPYLSYRFVFKYLCKIKKIKPLTGFDGIGAKFAPFITDSNHTIVE